jgi:hypothetical protein
MIGYFLYAEVQTSVPFSQAPWQQFNPAMKREPGLRRKTWLSGLATQTVGGLYEFDTLDNARAYVKNYLRGEADAVGGVGSLATMFYDAAVTEAASRDMASPWLVGLNQPRAAGRVFMKNDMHWDMPFDQVPWQKLNPLLKQQPGLITKQWLSGVSTNTVSGFYEFASKQDALAFAYGMFADECRKAGVTSNIKLFDADIVEAASRDMSSPYYPLNTRK